MVISIPCLICDWCRAKVRIQSPKDKLADGWLQMKVEMSGNVSGQSVFLLHACNKCVLRAKSDLRREGFAGNPIKSVSSNYCK